MAGTNEPSRTAFRVGVTGHRFLRDTTRIMDSCYDVLKRVRRERPGVIACSALAVGADTLFAEAALDLGISLEAVQPFEHYIEDFAVGSDRTRYVWVRSRARHVEVMPFAERSDDAYRSAGVWLVRNCQLLVAIWDGQPESLRGGTSDIIALAKRERVDVWNIHAERATEGIC